MACVVNLACFFKSLVIWNVPDSWGALGLRTIPLFTEEGGGGCREGVRDVSYHVTKARRRRDKRFQKMLETNAIVRL